MALAVAGSGYLLLGFGIVAIVVPLLNLFLGLAGQPIALSWIVRNLLIGLGLVAVGIAVNVAGFRERMATGEARRVGVYGASAIASTALGIAIVVLLAFLANRHSVRFDWSEAGEHSLAPQTLDLLDELDQDLEFLALFNALEVQPVRRLLERYGYASERVKIRYADPTERPELARAIERDALARGVVRVTLGEESTDVTEVTEERITNAILKLSRTQQKKVYFVTGHNERRSEGEGAGDASGFELAAESLRNENYAVEELLLASVGSVPEDADALLIAGPTRPFLEEERRALEEYLAGGGGLLVMIDPRANTDLPELLREWGVEVGNDVVHSLRHSRFPRPNAPYARSYGEHPITEGLREVTLFFIARSVRAAPGGDSRFTELVLSGEDSWAETDLDRWADTGEVSPDPEDPSGPQPLAVAGTVDLAAGVSTPDAGESEVEIDEAVDGRLVVFGDADFAANQLLAAHRNRDLFLNSVSWLLGDVESISIRPNRARSSSFQLSADEFGQINFLAALVVPQLLGLVGVFAWWSRRKAPGRQAS